MDELEEQEKGQTLKLNYLNLCSRRLKGGPLLEIAPRYVSDVSSDVNM